MLDFLLSPFKALYNVDTYIKAAKQSFGKNFLFLIYLTIFMSVLFLTGISLKIPPMDPFLREFITELAEVIPDITITDGIISAGDGEYIEIQPEGNLPKVVFETNRTEPVYPTQMQQKNIAIFVTSEKIYMTTNGQFKTHQLDKKINTVLNKQFFLDNQENIIENIKKFMILMALLVIPLIVLFMIGVSYVLAIVALVVAQVSAKTKFSFTNFMGISCYLISPALFFVFLVLIVLPFNIPAVWFFCFIILMIYSKLILTKVKMLEIENSSDETEANKD